MKRLTKIQHATLGIVALASLAISFSASAVTTAAASAANAATPKVLHVQNFQERELSTQFRYVNGTLIGIRFMNQAKRPIELRIFSNSYILGPKDSVVVNPPNVRYVVFTHELDPGVRTWANALLPDRFSHEHIYRLPMATTAKAK